MTTHPIRIIRSDPSTGSLVLSDHGHTIADAGDTILWQIDSNSGVDSIISIQEKSGSTNIFVRPPYQQGNNWRGDISPSAPPCTVYVYSITWSDVSGPHVSDPIISIKPSTISFKILIISLVTTCLGLFGISLFRHKKKSKK